MQRLVVYKLILPHDVLLSGYLVHFSIAFQVERPLTKFRLK